MKFPVLFFSRYGKNTICSNFKLHLLGSEFRGHSITKHCVRELINIKKFSLHTSDYVWKGLEEIGAGISSPQKQRRSNSEIEEGKVTEGGGLIISIIHSFQTKRHLG